MNELSNIEKIVRTTLFFQECVRKSYCVTREDAVCASRRFELTPDTAEDIRAAFLAAV